MSRMFFYLTPLLLVVNGEHHTLPAPLLVANAQHPRPLIVASDRSALLLEPCADPLEEEEDSTTTPFGIEHFSSFFRCGYGDDHSDLASSSSSSSLSSLGGDDEPLDMPLWETVSSPSDARALWWLQTEITWALEFLYRASPVVQKVENFAHWACVISALMVLSMMALVVEDFSSGFGAFSELLIESLMLTRHPSPFVGLKNSKSLLRGSVTWDHADLPLYSKKPQVSRAQVAPSTVQTIIQMDIVQCHDGGNYSTHHESENAMNNDDDADSRTPSWSYHCSDGSSMTHEECVPFMPQPQCFPFHISSGMSFDGRWQSDATFSIRGEADNSGLVADV